MLGLLVIPWRHIGEGAVKDANLVLNVGMQGRAGAGVCHSLGFNLRDMARI